MTPPGAASAGPPWVCKPSPQGQCDEFRRLEPARGVHPTGGLRPPLLLQCECLPAKNDFCDTHTHIRSGAAGVSPPWLTNRTCEDNSAHIRTRPSHAAPRAAGVSPPWLTNRTCEHNSGHIRTRPSHAAPRAAGVSPPWFVNRACEDNSAHIPTRPSHAAPRAASVSPPWVCKPGPQRECGGFRRLEPARGVHPTGGLRPPLLLQCERLPAKNDFCDTHTHIRSGAAGVSPPWVCKPRLQLQCDQFRLFEFPSAMHPTGALRLRRLHLACAEGDEFARRIHPTGGLRPPLLFRGAHVCRRKNDFCDTHTHIRSRAAGVSPPWLTKPTCHAVRFTFGKPPPSKNRGQTAAVRSVERCLRCVGNAHA
jgi:hypothetical protein